jgi:TPR repeat protein
VSLYGGYDAPMRAAAQEAPTGVHPRSEHLYVLGLEAFRNNRFQQAARTLALAAELGHARAQLHFGLLCEHGIGLDVNLERAHHWYRRAAGQGDADAYFRLRVVLATQTHAHSRERMESAGVLG